MLPSWSARLEGGLQLATVDHAALIFTREVIEPAQSAPRGVARVWALLDGFLDYIECEVFAGGCFFATTSAEFKHRPGVVRDRIAQHLASWDAYLARAVAQGQELGQIDSGTEARRIAFELKAFVHTAESHHQLFGDAGVFVDARDAVRERLDSLRPRTAEKATSLTG